MLQTMPNSQKIALVFIFLEYLVLTRVQVLFLLLSLLFKVEVSYASRALNKDILKAKLTNMLLRTRQLIAERTLSKTSTAWREIEIT